MANFCSQCGKPLMANANFCNQCGTVISKTQQGQLHEKRAKVIGKQTQRSARSYKNWVILAAVGLIVAWTYVNMPSSENKVIASQPVVTVAASYPPADQQMVDIPVKSEGSKISIPLDVVQKNKIVSFKLEERNVAIPLLAYITTDGKVVTAISVCEPCNSQRFHTKGETIVCNSCGTTWELNTLEAISGSCGKYPPDAIPNSLVGNEIQIDKSIIQSWRRRG
ncbi:MAG: Fe-S-containing protein [Bacteroidota bacterium]